MIKILAACGSGMGSSMIIKMNIDAVLKELNIEHTVEHVSVGQGKSMAKNFDIVIVQNVFVKDFSVDNHTKVIGLKNLMSKDEIRLKLKEVLGI
ncbi:MAG: PTS sugar transporter subunit IIB [Erysipelotrichaceae bacterium]